MKTFKLEDGDIVFDNLGNLKMVEGEDEFMQSLERRLSTNLGEWFLNIGLGLDYSDLTTKGRTKEDVELIIREAILQEERVESVEITKININNSDRSVQIKFKVTDSEGVQFVGGVVV